MSALQAPETLKYTASHEWVKEEDGFIVVGLTQFAQDSMGELVFIELPEVDDEVEAGSAFAEAESVKSVAEIFSPANGVVAEVNEELQDNPALVNQAPYEAWLVKIKGELAEELLDAAAYTALCQEA